MIRALATARRTVASVSIKGGVFDLAIFFLSGYVLMHALLPLSANQPAVSSPPVPSL
jgi:hypothetical protein